MGSEEFAKQIKEAKEKARGEADLAREKRERADKQVEDSRSRVKEIAKAIAAEIVAPCAVRFCRELPLPKPVVTEENNGMTPAILITCTGANGTAAAFRVRPEPNSAEKVNVGFCFYRSKSQLSFKGDDYSIEPIDKVAIQQWVENKLLQTVPQFLKAAAEQA